MNKLLKKQLIGKGCDYNTIPQNLAEWRELLLCISDIYDAKGNSMDALMTDNPSGELPELKKQLVEAEKLAGMSETAFSVLHNVGNILNSINVSLGLIKENSQITNLTRFFSAIELMKQHKDEINYLIEDPKGKLIPEFLIALSDKIKEENDFFFNEISSLDSHVKHVREIVNMHQTYCRATGSVEKVFLPDMAGCALQMCGDLRAHPIILVERIYEEIPFISVDKSRLLQILVNLIQNAKDAVMQDNDNFEKRIQIYIKKGINGNEIKVIVSDNGIGIDQNDIEKIFSFGFTKKVSGHGIGLHISALNAKEIGARIEAGSDGVGKGSMFTLTLALDPSNTGGQANG